MALTAEETTTFTARLAEAEQALHNLNMGTLARVIVDQNGERVEFTATNSTKLRAYIEELKTKLELNTSSLGPLIPWI